MEREALLRWSEVVVGAREEAVEERLASPLSECTEEGDSCSMLLSLELSSSEMLNCSEATNSSLLDADLGLAILFGAVAAFDDEALRPACW